MGLDIIHEKATYEKPKKLAAIDGLDTNVYTLENFKKFNVPFEYFSPYFQEVDFPLNRWLLLCKTEAIRQRELASMAEEDMLLFHCIVGDEDSAATVIQEYEEKNNLEEVTKIKSYRIDDYISINYSWVVKRIGFYVHEVGYQRKGVTNAFWQRFCNGQNCYFASQEDFIFAASCGKTQYDTDNLTKNFLDLYEPHCSFISVSY